MAKAGALLRPLPCCQQCCEEAAACLVRPLDVHQMVKVDHHVLAGLRWEEKSKPQGNVLETEDLLIAASSVQSSNARCSCKCCSMHGCTTPGRGPRTCCSCAAAVSAPAAAAGGSPACAPADTLSPRCKRLASMRLRRRLQEAAAAAALAAGRAAGSGSSAGVRGTGLAVAAPPAGRINRVAIWSF